MLGGSHLTCIAVGCGRDSVGGSNAEGAKKIDEE